MSTIIEKEVENYRIMAEIYNSAKEVVNDCDVREITDGCFHDMKHYDIREDWHGVKSYDEALKLMEVGYQPTVELLKEKLKGRNIGNGKRITFQNDIVGYAPVVPLALQGVPQNMINSRMKPIKCKVIDIYYDVTCSCGTSVEDIINNGSKILGAIIELEKAGYRFNLYGVQTYSSSRKCYMLVVKLKSSSQPMDLKRISFPLTHTAFFRVIGFDWYSKTPKGKYISGYGTGIGYNNSTEKINKMMNEMFGNNTVYFSGNKILKESEEHIKEVIENAGK